MKNEDSANKAKAIFFLKKIFCAKFVYIMYADKIRSKHI